MAQPNGLCFSFPIVSASEGDLEDINNLLRQLSASPRRLTREQLSAILKQHNFFLLVARGPDNHIIAMATIVIYETLMRRIGVIDDVVVDQNHRGKGHGRRTLETLIIFAKVRDLSYIDLTSKPSRIEANELYLSLGFKKRDTNCYRLPL